MKHFIFLLLILGATFTMAHGQLLNANNSQTPPDLRLHVAVENELVGTGSGGILNAKPTNVAFYGLDEKNLRFDTLDFNITLKEVVHFRSVKDSFYYASLLGCGTASLHKGNGVDTLVLTPALTGVSKLTFKSITKPQFAVRLAGKRWVEQPKDGSSYLNHTTLHWKSESTERFAFSWENPDVAKHIERRTNFPIYTLSNDAEEQAAFEKSEREIRETELAKLKVTSSTISLKAGDSKRILLYAGYKIFETPIEILRLY